MYRADVVLTGCEIVSFRSIDDGDPIVRRSAVVRQPRKTTDQSENENGFKRLGDRLAKTTKRSSFSIWLAKADNYDQLTAQMTTHGVRWGEIAQWAIDEGHAKKALTAVAAKRAYEREKTKRDKAAKTNPKPASVTGETRLNASPGPSVAQGPIVQPEPVKGFVDTDKPKSPSSRNFTVSTPRKGK